MIISDKHEFAFVHIPKCAGTSIRNALMPFDERVERYYAKAVSPHGVLGLIDYAHLPLAVLRDHFADDFKKLTAYWSFALVREPFSRFPSSLHERFVQSSGPPLSERDLQQVAREVDTVMARLAVHSKSEPVTDPELIHFSRQYDYIFLDGSQIVQDPRTVTRLGAILSDVSERTGQPVQLKERKNQRIVYRSKTVRTLKEAITAPIERLLPRWIWKPAYAPVKFAFRATGLTRPDKNDLSNLPNFQDIKAFISEFYADDIALYARLRACEADDEDQLVSSGARV